MKYNLLDHIYYATQSFLNHNKFNFITISKIQCKVNNYYQIQYHALSWLITPLVWKYFWKLRFNLNSLIYSNIYLRNFVLIFFITKENILIILYAYSVVFLVYNCVKIKICSGLHSLENAEGGCKGLAVIFIQNLN